MNHLRARQLPKISNTHSPIADLEHPFALSLSIVPATNAIEKDSALGYFVVIHGGRRFAVPPNALSLGPGALEFSMEVDEVIDLVASREIVGRIGEARVHVALPVGSQTPNRGSRIDVHAERAFELR